MIILLRSTVEVNHNGRGVKNVGLQKSIILIVEYSIDYSGDLSSNRLRNALPRLRLFFFFTSLQFYIRNVGEPLNMLHVISI